MIPNMDFIIMDTNVLLSAFLSKRGASHLLLSLIETGVFKHAVSTALVLEYEDVLLRNRAKIGLGIEEIRTVIDYITGSAMRVPIYYRWRPYLKDPGDDCLLEVAISAGANRIVTYNTKDFKGVEKDFSIQVLNALDYLKLKGVII